MKGIDIYQGERKSGTTLKAIPEKAYKESDFVIVKSTQGVSYKYTSFFHDMIKRAKRDKKLIGAYHYAAGNDPIKEADYFISVVKPYLGSILLALDWESYQNKKWGNKTWAKKFVDRVKEKTGITCVLYTGSDGCKQCQNLIGVTPLWFAGFPKPQKTTFDVPAFKYNLGKWGSYPAIWQYTSSNEKVDRNTTKWTAADWRKQCLPEVTVKKMLALLEEYHHYIKAHSKSFINHYDGEMTTFEKAKLYVNKGKSVGMTCVVALRWALAEFGIKNGDGKSLISAPNGTFKKYYTGDVTKFFTRITTGKVVGKTFKQAVDEGLIKAGDIFCYKDFTHTSVYSGKGYLCYEGGGAAVKNDHYPNGILVDCSKYHVGRKIAEVLRMKNQVEEKKVETKTTTKKKYTGTIPTLPPRGYYKEGDGMKTLTSYVDKIKAVQKALNWAVTNVKLEVDGKYGKKTTSAVKAYQKAYGLTVDGEWGKQCNNMLKKIER